MIETFGKTELNQAFWLVLLMTAPVWLLMLFFPSKSWTRVLANPFLFPVLLLGVLGYLYYLLWQLGVPSIPQNVQFEASRNFVQHPIVWLIAFCKLQILNLFLGTVLFREAHRMGMRMIPLELLTCWFFGPLGLLVFILHLLLRLAFKR